MLTRRSLMCFGALPLAGAEQHLALRSQQLEAVVVPSQGGEIASLRYRFRGETVELLYRALDYATREGWRGKAPWLWPATGRNFAPGQTPDGGNDVTGSYLWDEARRAIPIHGFARMQPWRTVAASDSDIELALAPSEQTKQWYPWDWELRVRYRLRGNEIAIRFTAAAGAANSSPMPFSAGNHITFRDPLLPGGVAGKLRFTTNSTLQFAKSKEGLPTGEQRERRFPAPVAISEIAPEYPLSLGGYPREAWLRMEDPSGLRIEFAHEASELPAEPVIRFNVWGTAECFSPEPWVGLQNSLNRRQGLMLLAPGKTWTWDWRIRVSG